MASCFGSVPRMSLDSKNKPVMWLGYVLVMFLGRRRWVDTTAEPAMVARFVCGRAVSR
jgi:hypothetical protein